MDLLLRLVLPLLGKNRFISEEREVEMQIGRNELNLRVEEQMKASEVIN